MLSTHSATPTLLVSFDQSNLLNVDFYITHFIMWNSVLSVLVLQIVFFNVKPFCDEIDRIFNHILTTLLDNDIV